MEEYSGELWRCGIEGCAQQNPVSNTLCWACGRAQPIERSWEGETEQQSSAVAFLLATLVAVLQVLLVAAELALNLSSNGSLTAGGLFLFMLTGLVVWWFQLTPLTCVMCGGGLASEDDRLLKRWSKTLRAALRGNRCGVCARRSGSCTKS